MYGFEIERRGNTERYVKRLYDLSGKHVGTISISKPASSSKSGKKKKAADYSFKRVSSQVLNARTSSKAEQVSNGIRIKIYALYKKLKDSDYDEEEVRRSILHAESVRRACEKKKKNLKMEEEAERKMDGELPEEPDDSLEKAQSDEELRELEAEEFEALMEKLEMDSEEMYELAEETAELDSSLNEMAEALSGAMEPEDLKQLKIKHRSDEARDILKADLKYLKALFDRLQSEKEQAGHSAGSGVSLSIGGSEPLPVSLSDSSAASDVGNNVDAEA